MLTVRVPEGRLPEREYAVRVLLEEFLGLRAEVVVGEGRDTTEISVVGDDRRRLVVADALFAVPDDAWLRVESLPRTPLARLTPPDGHPEREIPVLYGADGWRREGDVLTLEVDIFGSSFFLLTRYEELVVQTRDTHDRFPASASLLVREGLHRRPLVNEYLELLWLALHALWPQLTRRTLEHTVAPSHDVDWPLAADRTVTGVLQRAAADALRRRDPLVAGRRLVGHAARALGRNELDVNNTFDAIMAASEQRGLRSAFYFIAGRRAGSVDGDYSLDDPWIRGLLGRIHERGHEIGMHASYTTYLDPEQTQRERDTLVRVLDELGIEQPRLGTRQHFLRWRAPQTWRNCDDAGLDYDTTVGYADDLGFRAGVCLEYPVFDLERRRTLRLRELPLVAMEVAALDGLGLDHARAAAVLSELEGTCRRYGGTFTLLWHNSRLVHGRERRLYLRALGSPNSGSTLTPRRASSV